MLTCTFAGHREVFHKGIDKKLLKTLKQLAKLDSEFCFYFGGMGDFDSMCVSAVLELMCLYRQKKFRMVLVAPYMTKHLNDFRECYEMLYDEIIIPGESAEVYFKRSIFARNRWMADQSEYMIAYVHRDFGGAYDTMKYAEGKGVKVINLVGE